MVHLLPEALQDLMTARNLNLFLLAVRMTSAGAARRDAILAAIGMEVNPKFVKFSARQSFAAVAQSRARGWCGAISRNGVNVRKDQYSDSFQRANFWTDWFGVAGWIANLRFGRRSCSLAAPEESRFLVASRLGMTIFGAR
jgi:hypothetical protein